MGMKSNLRKMTIVIEQGVARWVRGEAARQNVDVSRLVGAILKERMLNDQGYERAMRRAMAHKPCFKTDGRYLSREEAHDRAGLR
jgi:hypothetical protein